MLFSRNPKRTRREFFDRDNELNTLFKGLEVGEGLIVVYGIRRIGKTSLVLVALDTIGYPYVFIDVRRLAENPSLLSPYGVALFVREAFSMYRSCRTGLSECIRSIVRRIEAIDLGLLSMRLREGVRRELFTDLLTSIDEWVSSIGSRFVIVFDEAQELRIVPVWRKLLAWSIDSLSNICFIITGSEIGVLHGFLKLDDQVSPLYGRPRLDLRVDRFSHELSIEFLNRGFMEAGVRVGRDEVEEAVDRLDGVVGWLNLYGYYRVGYGLEHREALNRLESEASRLVASELEKLVKYSPKRYLAVLKALSIGLKRWSDIKRYVNGFIGSVTDTKLDNILKKLIKYSFVEKTPTREYRLVDPLTPKAIEYLLKKYRIT